MIEQKPAMRLMVLVDRAGDIIAAHITGADIPGAVVPGRENAVRRRVAFEPEEDQVVHEFDVPDDMLEEGRPLLHNIAHYRIEMTPEPRLVRDGRQGQGS